MDEADIALYVSAKKSNEEIAKEVIAGKWGNGSDRKARLTAAGYNYNTTDKGINNKITNSKTKFICIIYTQQT